MLRITETKCSSALVKCGLPADDFVINPYGGCAFGCIYCYADFTRRFQGHLEDNWGEYVDVRVNIAEVLDKEVRNLMKRINRGDPILWKNKKYPVVFISSVTDPYQGVEAQYELTRKCLQVFIAHKFPGEISILTKSPLVARDIDLFRKLERISVGMTITSTDDDVGRLFERFAPPVSNRIKALKKLNEAGVPTYVCVNPLLPHFVTTPKRIDELFKAIKDAGTNAMYIEHLNLSGNKKRRLFELLKGKVDTAVLEEIWFSQSDEYKRELEALVYQTLEKYQLQVLGGGIIDHERMMGKGTEFVFR